MKNKVNIKVAGISLTVKRLTVREIADWVDQQLTVAKETDTGADLVPLLMPVGDMSLADLLYMTDASFDDLQDLTEADLERVLEKCKEVNKAFFTVAQRMNLANVMASQLVTQPETDSNGCAAPLSDTDT